MVIDRALQLEYLEALANVFPSRLGVQPWTNANPSANANLHYLFQHGLIGGSHSQSIGGGKEFVVAEITAKGLDFLADDGGLSAVLGLVTFKLHDDTVRALIEAKIETSDLPPEEKSSLMKAVREIPVDILKRVTEKLIDAGLENWPTALVAIKLLMPGA